MGVRTHLLSNKIVEFSRSAQRTYSDLYQHYFKGNEKYAHILVDWHKKLSQFAVPGSSDTDILWAKLVEGDVNDRSAIVTVLATAVYDILQSMATQPLALHSYPQSNESVEDDDASIIRVWICSIFCYFTTQKSPAKEPTTQTPPDFATTVKE